MQDKIELVKELLHNAEGFAKTNIELIKLKAIDKGTDVFSAVTSSVIIGIVMLFFVSMTSFGAAMWIGESMGHYYYGFMIVAGFYLLLAIILVATNKVFLERSLNNYIVRLIFKEKNNDGNKK